MDIEQGTYHQLYLDTLSLSELAAISDKLRDEVIDLGRRTVEKSWELGGVLLAAKDQVDHGDWMPWLADRLISHDIAKRLMNLHAGYPQKVKIALFDSVNVALKRLPAKTDPERIATQRPPATATKGEVIEMVEAEAMPAHIMRALVREKVESYLEAVLKTRTAFEKLSNQPPDASQNAPYHRYIHPICLIFYFCFRAYNNFKTASERRKGHYGCHTPAEHRGVW